MSDVGHGIFSAYERAFRALRRMEGRLGAVTEEPPCFQPLPSRFPAASQPRPELDPPMGLANFARNLDFDDWQAQPLTAKRARCER